jgi:hypothetical protein
VGERIQKNEGAGRVEAGVMTAFQEESANRNYEWFKKNLSELVLKYEDQHVVVKDEAVIAAYPSFETALVETIKTEAPGTFIIQLCSLDESKTTVSIPTLWTPRDITAGRWYNVSQK